MVQGGLPRKPVLDLALKHVCRPSGAGGRLFVLRQSRPLKSLGLTVPASVLASADEVIE